MNSIAERNSAYQSVKAEGVAMTLNQSVNGAYSTDTRSVTNTSNIYPTYGLIKETRLFEVDGSLVKRGDKRIIMGISPSMPTPCSDDTVTILGETLNVVECTAINPAGVPILFNVWLRKP